MHNKYLIILLGTAILLFNGCEDKKVKESVGEVATAEGIVVTQNAVKALKKEDDSKENSGKFYYSYNKEKKKSQYNTETEKARTELDAYRDIRSPYEKIRITLMIKQLSPDYHLLCSACHDDYANGIVGPELLDKNASFIFKRIMAFKSGDKKNILMKDLVNKIDEKRLQGVAKEIERFNKEIKEMRSK